MSMIHDALRRANSPAVGEKPQSERSSGAVIPEGRGQRGEVRGQTAGPQTPLAPPKAPARAKTTSKGWLIVVLAVLFLIGAAAGAYFWKGRSPVEIQARQAGVKPAPKQAEAGQRAEGRGQSSEAIAEPILAGEIIKEVVLSNEAPAVVKSTSPITPPTSPLPIPHSAVHTPQSTLRTPQAPVEFPALRLQGIYYRPQNPSVLISGRTLYLNEQIKGVTVVAIDPTSVTLVLSGQTNILTLR